MTRFLGGLSDKKEKCGVCGKVDFCVKTSGKPICETCYNNV